MAVNPVDHRTAMIREDFTLIADHKSNLISVTKSAAYNNIYSSLS